MRLSSARHPICKNHHVEALKERFEVRRNYYHLGPIADITMRPRTLGCKKLLLRGLHLVNAIERKGKLLGLVFGIRDADNVEGTTLVTGFAAHYNIFVELPAQERSDSRDNLENGQRKLVGDSRDSNGIPRTDMTDQLSQEKTN